MTTRSFVSLAAVLLLWLALLALAPQRCSAQDTPPNPAGTSGGASGETPSAATLKKGTRAGAPTEKQPAPSVAAEAAPPAQRAQSDAAPILNGIGLGLAALASIGALVFAVLAWRGTNKIRRDTHRADRTVADTFQKLSTQIPATVSADIRTPLKTLSADLERFSQAMTHTATQAIKSAVAQSQPPAPVSLQAPSEQRESGSPSGAMADLTGRLDHIAQANRDILGAVQSLRPQPAPSPTPLAPQAPSLPALIAQAADPSDPLAKLGQRLQATFQKLVTGSRAGEAFIESRDGGLLLDSLAQTVFVPLSVPLAPTNLTEAQMNHRISLLGAIERTRMQAAALTRGMGLEIMPVEVWKTHFDGNRHETKAGTEIQTDLAEMNGKVAEVLDHGFLQKRRDNSTRVIRKSRVRLYLLAPPKPTAAPSVSVAPPAVIETAPEPAVPVTAPTTIAAVAPEETAPEAVTQPEPIVQPSVPRPGPASAPFEGADDVHAAQQQIEAYKGTSSALPLIAEWGVVAESLTILHRKGRWDAAALDAMLGKVFTDVRPQCLLPQIGEATRPLYEVSASPSSGCVVAVLRVGIELPREGGIYRPVVPLVRLGPSQESSQL